MPHTHGPWEVHEGTSGWLEVIADHGDHIYENIANLSPRNTCGVLEKKANHAANALLIAAAPELLDALKAVLADEGLLDLIAGIGEEPPFWKAALDAIAKAEGK